MYNEEIIEELNEIYEFFKEVDKYKRMWNDPIKSYTANGKTIYLHTNSPNPFAYSRLTAFLVNYYNMTNKPQIIDDTVYENLNSTLVYRGERTTEHARNLIQDEDYHTGGGTFGDAIYTTTSKDFAKCYSYCWDNKKPGICVEYKLIPDALILSNSTLEKLKDLIKLHYYNHKIDLENLNIINKERFLALLDYLKYKGDEYFTESFIAEHSNALAIYLGYDILQANDSYYMILNRNKLCLSESEYNRVIEQAKKEKLKKKTSEPTQETLELF